jgi:hypothetical protein
MIVLDMRLVHSFGMVCVNLKPSNVLFNKSHRIQIMDIVGSPSESHDRAERHGSVENAESMSGMPSEFAAPEVLSGDKVTRAADVFSFWSNSAFIVFNHREFGQTDERNVVSEEIPGFVPQFISQLIELRLSPNPSERSSFYDIFDSLERNGLRSTEQVNSEEVSAFVSSVEWSVS